MDMYTYAYASPYANEDILTPVPMGRYPNVIVPYLPTSMNPGCAGAFSYVCVGPGL